MKLWPRRNQKNEKVQRENKQIKDIRGKQRKLSLQSNLCLELSAVGLPVKLKRYVTVSVKNFIILKKGWFSASTVWIGSISLVSGTQVLPKNWKKSVLLVQLVWWPKVESKKSFSYKYTIIYLKRMLQFINIFHHSYSKQDSINDFSIVLKIIIL